uniref:Inhibitor of growth protein n=1 Tax=Clastoptera arizonana TaxID=38151 RepID=A0A1B6D9N5_9HEMI
MLYLEDYLEMIEHLPQELRDRFTEMREMDLQVQNSMDSLEKKVKVFFSNIKKMNPEETDSEFEGIRKDYYKTLEDADEKVQLANHMHDLVSRYLRRLDQESHKFKMELEADHPGITEILEKRSQELDQLPSNNCQKENRFSFNPSRSSNTERRNDISADHKRIMNNMEKLLPELRLAAATPQPLPTLVNIPSAAPSPVNYSLGHMGAGGTAIAAAASQAIAATQQMQQGRRTASLKASYEAIHSASGGTAGVGTGSSGSHTHELSISKELAGAAQTAIAAIQDTNKKQKKKSSIASNNSAMGMPAISLPVAAPLPSPNEPSTSERSDSSYDPNEPRYCICNEVAFGDMVACDNKTCPYEWFHYQCVGITDPPKGKWYCPQCMSAMKRRGPRKSAPKASIRDAL